MTSSNGNIFRVTGHLSITFSRQLPYKKRQDYVYGKQEKKGINVSESKTENVYNYVKLIDQPMS